MNDKYVKLIIEVKRPHGDPDRYEIEIPVEERQAFSEFIHSWNLESVEIRAALSAY